MASLDPIEGVLGTKRAFHLLHRLTFGPTRPEVDRFAGLSIEQALTELLAGKPAPAPPIDPKTGQPWIITTSANTGDGDLRNYFRCWFYGQMFSSGTNAIEKLTFFLHTHFTAISSVIDKSTSLYFQNQLLRRYALGNFKELAWKICTDNAMLVLLDNRLNENVKPNENFAREFLELFTIGKGKEIGPGNYTTYTELDIQAAARILSGWDTDVTYSTLDATTGIPTGKLKLNSAQLPTRHDAEAKTFSAAFQNTTIKPGTLSGKYATAEAAVNELKEMVDMIFAQEATARNICRKLYRFFVYYKITEEVETAVIGPLAQLFISSNFELKPVLELLLKSKHFFDEDNSATPDDKRGAIIKSPLEITIGMMRFFGITLPDATTTPLPFYEAAGYVIDAMNDQGFDLYEPLDVAGYDAYFQSPGYNRNWISANYLARRYQFAENILKGKDQDPDKLGWKLRLDSMAFVSNPANISDPSNADKLAREAIAYLLPEAITEERFTFFQNILLDNLSTINWGNEWRAYQASGDDMGVRSQLDAFFNALLQSAEYQLS